MKALLKFFVLAIIPFALLSCNDDDEPTQTYIGLGVIQNDYSSTGETAIKLDDGTVLIPSNTIPSYEDEERITVRFSYYDSEEELDEVAATIYNIEEVLTKDVVVLTEENREEIGEDPIHVHEEDIWVAGGYLNIYFEYLGSGTVSHFINMAIDEEFKYDQDGRLILTFKHNAYNDYKNFWYPGLVSFDMESLRQGEETEVEFVVYIEDYSGLILEWEDTYEFGAAKPSFKSIKDIPETGSFN